MRFVHGIVLESVLTDSGLSLTLALEQPVFFLHSGGSLYAHPVPRIDVGEEVQLYYLRDQQKTLNAGNSPAIVAVQVLREGKPVFSVVYETEYLRFV